MGMVEIGVAWDRARCDGVASRKEGVGPLLEQREGAVEDIGVVRGEVEWRIVIGSAAFS